MADKPEQNIEQEPSIEEKNAAFEEIQKEIFDRKFSELSGEEKNKKIEQIRADIEDVSRLDKINKDKPRISKYAGYQMFDDGYDVGGVEKMKVAARVFNIFLGKIGEGEKIPYGVEDFDTFTGEMAVKMEERIKQKIAEKAVAAAQPPVPEPTSEPSVVSGTETKPADNTPKPEANPAESPAPPAAEAANPEAEENSELSERVANLTGFLLHLEGVKKGEEFHKKLRPALDALGKKDIGLAIDLANKAIEKRTEAINKEKTFGANWKVFEYVKLAIYSPHVNFRPDELSLIGEYIKALKGGSMKEKAEEMEKQLNKKIEAQRAPKPDEPPADTPEPPPPSPPPAGGAPAATVEPPTPDAVPPAATTKPAETVVPPETAPKPAGTEGVRPAEGEREENLDFGPDKEALRQDLGRAWQEWERAKKEKADLAKQAGILNGVRDEYQELTKNDLDEEAQKKAKADLGKPPEPGEKKYVYIKNRAEYKTYLERTSAYKRMEDNAKAEVSNYIVSKKFEGLSDKKKVEYKKKSEAYGQKYTPEQIFYSELEEKREKINTLLKEEDKLSMEVFCLLLEDGHDLLDADVKKSQIVISKGILGFDSRYIDSKYISDANERIKKFVGKQVEKKIDEKWEEAQARWKERVIDAKAALVKEAADTANPSPAPTPEASAEKKDVTAPPIQENARKLKEKQEIDDKDSRLKKEVAEIKSFSDLLQFSIKEGLKGEGNRGARGIICEYRDIIRGEIFDDAGMTEIRRIINKLNVETKYGFRDKAIELLTEKARFYFEDYAKIKEEWRKRDETKVESAGFTKKAFDNTKNWLGKIWGKISR